MYYKTHRSIVESALNTYEFRFALWERNIQSKECYSSTDL